MPISSLEIMKTIDGREMQKTKKEKQTKTERSKGNRSYSVKGWELNDFVVSLSLVFSSWYVKFL